MVKQIYLLIAIAAVQQLEVHSFSLATNRRRDISRTLPLLHSSTDTTTPPPTSTDEEESNYEPPEDAIIAIKPKAMARLLELKQKRDTDTKNSVDPSTPLILRMGVRNGDARVYRT